MTSMAGNWVRYKVENEKNQMTYLGWGELYESMKSVEPTMEITEKSPDVHLEVYKRGDWTQNYLVNIGGESEFDMADGTKAKVYPKYDNAEKTKVRYEFDFKGIHHCYIRELTADDQLVDYVDYDNGKCKAVHYFKRA